jgi:hypothetical protein
LTEKRLNPGLLVVKLVNPSKNGRAPLRKTPPTSAPPPGKSFMPIRVKCVCQQQFDAPDNLAGKTVKCPKCASPIVIPSPAAAMAARAPGPPSAVAALLDEVGVKQRSLTACPSCGAHHEPDAVLCVECGFNFRTGRRIEMKGAAPGMDPGDGHTVNAEFLIQKALRDQEADRVMQKKLMSFGIPWWGYLLILIGLIGFIVGMGSLPQDVAMTVAGWILLSAAILLGVVSRIWFLVAAFKVSIVWFLVVFFIPAGDWIFAFTNWDEGAGPFFLELGSILLSFLAFFAFWLSTVLISEEGEAMLTVIQTAIPV